MMNLLSIDWDYFFPNISEYDWQMNEKMFLYYEFIWHIRWSNHNMRGTKKAKESFIINNKLFDDFWGKVLNRNEAMPILFIADTHTDIKRVFQIFKGSKFDIWNFDQHHDLGYSGSNQSLLDCGNWADHFKSRINQYNLVYPPWRKDKPEDIEFNKSINVYYSIPSELPKFDVLFICRSSPFTPSWYDYKWIEFIQYFEQFPIQWRTKVFAPYAIKARKFNLKEAKKYENEFKELLNKKINPRG